MADINNLVKQAISGMDFGTVHMTFKIDNKHLSTVDTNKYTSYRIEKGNVEALTVVGTLLKGTAIATRQSPSSIPPTLTFTVFFGKDGEADRLAIQDFKRTNSEKK